MPEVPRAGKKNVDTMAYDFLNAWLVEGNVVAAMGSVSPRAYACLARDAPDPDTFDRGIAPYQLMGNLKAAYDALGPHNSLDGLIVGVRVATPALKAVNQPHHAQFVIYAVPDGIAAAFDCETQMTPGGAKASQRAYGNFFGTTFYVSGPQSQRVALLWAKDSGYWKIVAWKIGIDDGVANLPDTAPEVKVAHIKADTAVVQVARTFLETWLVRRDYDAAFGYLSTRSYACYDLWRNPDAPAAASMDDAARRIRAAPEVIGTRSGGAARLESIISGVEPSHPSVRVMDHPGSRTFGLTSLPTALADAAECDARARGAVPPEPMPPEYGDAFGLSVRFGPPDRDAPVLRLLWRKEQGMWRITAYSVEAP